MEINLDSYEITKAIKMYLKARGVNWEDDYLEMYLKNEEQDIINLNDLNNFSAFFVFSIK